MKNSICNIVVTTNVTYHAVDSERGRVVSTSPEPVLDAGKLLEVVELKYRGKVFEHFVVELDAVFIRGCRSFQLLSGNLTNPTRQL